MDAQGRWKTMHALVDCSATSIFVSPQLVERLRVSTSPVHVATYGLDGKVLMHARDSLKTAISVQYFDYLAPIEESNVLVVPMQAYDLVLGLPWFRTRNPEIDWARSHLLSLRTPSGSALYTSPLTVRSDGEAMAIGLTTTPSPDGLRCGAGKGPVKAVEIEMLSAMSMGDLLLSQEVANAFALKLKDGECKGLLGATVDSTTSKGD